MKARKLSIVKAFVWFSHSECLKLRRLQEKRNRKWTKKVILLVTKIMLFCLALFWFKNFSPSCLVFGWEKNEKTQNGSKWEREDRGIKMIKLDANEADNAVEPLGQISTLHRREQGNHRVMGREWENNANVCLVLSFHKNCTNFGLGALGARIKELNPKKVEQKAESYEANDTLMNEQMMCSERSESAECTADLCTYWISFVRLFLSQNYQLCLAH